MKLLLATVTGLLVLAGCGGTTPTPAQHSEEAASTAASTTPAVPTISHEEFISKLDGLCRKSKNASERKYGKQFDAAKAANDYDALARLYGSRSG